MEVKTVYAVYFSATGKTRRIATMLANAIAVALEVPLEIVDYTAPAARRESSAFTETDLVIFASPTYAGKLPNKLLPFVQTGFAGNGALAVPVVTFGNRSYDNSLAELCSVLQENGFHTVAAGAFVCRHAFTDELAYGRPGWSDQFEMKDFARRVMQKVKKLTELPVAVQVPGDAAAPYAVHSPYHHERDHDLCVCVLYPRLL